MGTDSNKALGTAFEEAFAEELYNRGFWVHLLRQTEAGQPADLIAARNGKTFLIDAKVCSGGKFPLSRIEENQKLAMTEFLARGNEAGWFALLLDGETYMLPLSFMMRYPTPYLNRAQIKHYGETLEDWLKEWFVL